MHTHEVKRSIQARSYWLNAKNVGMLKSTWIPSCDRNFVFEAEKKICQHQETGQVESQAESQAESEGSQESSIYSSDKVLVRAICSGVSPGTERLVASGKVPKECHQTMRCQYMQGGFEFPLKYGYSMVGCVESGDNAGRSVYLMHPHQDWFFVDSDNLLFLPSGFDLRNASLLANAETALNGIWDAAVLPGETVLVVGGGVVGALLCFILEKIPGVKITLVEIEPQKRRLLRQLGWNINVCAPSEVPLPSNSSKTSGFDLAFNTAGGGFSGAPFEASNGLQLCIESVGFSGRIVEMSWYGSSSTEVYLGGSFHFSRKKIISSQVSQIASVAQDRWDFRRRLKTALEIISLPEVGRMITDSVMFSDLPEFMAAIYRNDYRGLSAVVEYP